MGRLLVTKRSGSFTPKRKKQRAFNTEGLVGLGRVSRGAAGGGKRFNRKFLRQSLQMPGLLVCNLVSADGVSYQR